MIFFTIPNMFTYLRIVLIVVLLVSFLDYSYWSESMRLLIFVIAASTDFIDGYVARLWSLQSTIGRIMDPIADKLLVCTSLLLLTSVGLISGQALIPAAIIICREIVISNFRALLAEQHETLDVSNVAKYKTIIQLIAIGMLMAGSFGVSVFPPILLIANVLLWISALFTVYTAYIYLQSNATKLSG